MNDDFGNRMKAYERTGSATLMPLLPVLARLDGKCFHNFTRDMNRPFDVHFIEMMQITTKWLVEQTNARIGYTQSDEITLLFYQDNYKSEIFMGGKSNKLISILASMATAYFNKNLFRLSDKKGSMPLFDCRVWNVPNQIEAVNVFIWREQDAVRNSIQMAGQSQFSHKQLQGKSCDEIQEMLFKEKGINWNSYPSYCKRGSYFQSKKIKKAFTADEIEKLPLHHDARSNPDLEIIRRVVERVTMPVLTTVTNKVAVLFDGSQPILGSMSSISVSTKR